MIIAIIIVGVLLLMFFSAKGQVEDNYAEVAAQRAEGQEPVTPVSLLGEAGCMLIATVIIGAGLAIVFGGMVGLIPK